MKHRSFSLIVLLVAFLSEVEAQQKLSIHQAVELEVTTEPGVDNELQSSENMTTWTTEESIAGDGNTTYYFCSTRDAPKRFYRLYSIPEDLVLIPAGNFTMGNTMNSTEGGSSELPVHIVYVSAFYMQTKEVGKAQWDGVADWAWGNGYDINNASASGKGPTHPAYNVNWYECVKWCNARSEQDGLTPCYTINETVYKTGHSNSVACSFSANGYRLPTEAEWEKAARGGSSGIRFPWGDTISHSQANYNSSSVYSYDVSPTQGCHPTYNDGTTPYTSPVGSLAPNGYGLYDMIGNVWEWCNDWYSVSYYSSSPSSNPMGPGSGSVRVLRGGAWDNYAASCRAAYRGTDNPAFVYDNRGFRAVRTASP